MKEKGILGVFKSLVREYRAHSGGLRAVKFDGLLI